MLVVRDYRTNQTAGDVLKLAGFDKWEEIVIRDDAYDHWPESCNLMFRRAAKHVEYGSKEPFLWLEPDVVPLKTECFDAIETEYRASGKPFSGDFVHVPEMGDVPDHCSGIAVYPGALSNFAGTAYLAHERAWDVEASSQIVPQMHKSKHILHRWKHPPFENWQQVEERIFAVKPEAVLFHADKTSSLIDLLRQKRSGVQTLAEAPNENTAPTCSIFVKTWAQDYPWLSYCLQSIAKFSQEFEIVIIVSSEAGIPNPDPTSFQEIILPEPAGSDGYLWQQIRKLHADLYTDSDFICTLDSDTIFTRAVTPQNYFTDGKIDWMMTPYSMVETPWKPITEKFLGRPVEFEFMRRAPVVLPRWIYEALRNFCVQQHGRTLEQYIIEQPHRAFSEYNAIGAFAYYFHHDKFNWINTGEVPESEWPTLTVLQKKSWDGLTPQIVAEFEEVLKGGDAGCTSASANTKIEESASPISSAAPTFKPERPAENPNIKQTKEGIWILARDSHISKWIEEKGQLQHDYETLPKVLEEIPVGGTVVDVGAFVGDTTAPFLQRVGPEGKVLAFEPNLDAFKCLKRNCPKAQCYPFALGAPGDPWLELAPCDNAGARYLRKFGFDNDKGQAVNIATLDSLNLDTCSFLKLDCEGAETRVLKGAEQTIDRFHPKMLIELNEGALQRQGTNQLEICSWLQAHGYKWWPVQANLAPDSPQYDILCTYAKTEQPNSESASTVTASVVDWSKFEQDARFSLATVRSLAEQLKGFMGNSVTTRQVRNVLHEVGVINLPYRFRKRKGWKKKKAKA